MTDLKTPAGPRPGGQRRHTLVAVAAAVLLAGVVIYVATGRTGPSGDVVVPPAPVDRAPDTSLVPTGPGGDWNLVFHDEFGGSELDLTKWIPCVSAGWHAHDRQRCSGWGEELQRYHLSNVTVSDGAAHLVAQREDDGTYTSGAIATAEDAFGFDQPGYEPFGYLYGYFEVRIRTPDQPGMWPAVWSMPVGGGGKGEMDLYELMSGPEDPERISMTLHGDSAPEIVDQAHPVIPDIADNYHVFGAEWTPDSLTYWVDGRPIHTITERIPQAPHFLMANLAIGGQVGPPDPDQQWPLEMDIDYMRVFQR